MGNDRSDNPEDLAELIKKYRKQRCQSVLLVFIAFTMLVASCIAWFVNNTRVSADGIRIISQGSRFEIASKKEANAGTGIEDSAFSLSGSTIEWANPADPADKYLLADTDGVSSLLVSENDNFDNHKEGSGLQPGAAGSLTFYLIPLADDIKEITLDLSFTLYGKDTDGELVEIADPIIADLMQGHLLFFQSKSGAGHYSEWFQNGKFTVKPTGGAEYFTKDSPHQITVYWVWPLTFKRYVKVGGYNLFSTSSDAGYQKILEDMNTNPDKYFAGVTDLPAVSADMEDTAISSCSTAYNEADDTIGKSVRYIKAFISVYE